MSMDTSVWWSGDLFSAMRTTLGADRSREHLEAHVKGDTVTALSLRAEHVVDWATRGGAQALGRDDLGRLTPGAETDGAATAADARRAWFRALGRRGLRAHAEGDHARHGIRRVPRSVGGRSSPPRGAGP